MKKFLEILVLEFKSVKGRNDITKDALK